MVLLVSSLSLDEDLALEGLDKGLVAKVLSMELDLLCLANFNMIDQFKPAKNKGILRNMWFCDYNHLFACLDVNATHVCVYAYYLRLSSGYLSGFFVLITMSNSDMENKRMETMNHTVDTFRGKLLSTA